MDTDRYLKIRKELDEIKGILKNVSNQMQELREAIRGAPIPTQMLSVPQPYVHPRWKYQWTGSIFGGNNFRNQPQASSVNLDESRFTISRGKKEAQGETNSI
jgi:hypothetical protein